ncbi:MAG TPA: aquaporin, partial [Streptosporangiaceae bacterium]|nr:aquaporin [Streptosporangiaceae bacterium]
GASMNPARSFGPALAAGQWHEFWLYVAGPVLGAVIGAFAYQLVRGQPADMPPARPDPSAAPEGSDTAERALSVANL